MMLSRGCLIDRYRYVAVVIEGGGSFCTLFPMRFPILVKEGQTSNVLMSVVNCLVSRYHSSLRHPRRHFVIHLIPRFNQTWCLQQVTNFHINFHIMNIDVFISWQVQKKSLLNFQAGVAPRKTSTSLSHLPLHLHNW